MLRIIARCIELSTKLFQCEDVHLSRFLLYKSLAGLAAGTNASAVASISGSQRLCQIMGFSTEAIRNLDYPAHDVRSLNFPDCYFDACIADQVLEHVEEDPFLVLRECARVTKPNGIVVQATVMTYPIHFGPKDLWRFTPEGMLLLIERAGLKPLHSGSWGGRRAVGLSMLGLGQMRVPKNPLHPVRRIAMDSGAEWPVVVWAVGKKH